MISSRRARRFSRTRGATRAWSSSLVRMVPGPTLALMVSALWSRISRICWRESGLMLRSRSDRSTGCRGARPSSWRTRLISSAPTPLSERERTKAFLMARTSRCERDVLLEPRLWAWLLIMSREFSFRRRTSPALISPVEMSWNCWMPMLMLA